MIVIQFLCAAVLMCSILFFFLRRMLSRITTVFAIDILIATIIYNLGSEIGAMVFSFSTIVSLLVIFLLGSKIINMAQNTKNVSVTSVGLSFTAILLIGGIYVGLLLFSNKQIDILGSILDFKKIQMLSLSNERIFSIYILLAISITSIIFILKDVYKIRKTEC